MGKRICFVESSVPFDGFGPTSRPLDSGPRALAYLAAALAQRGHEISVINKADFPALCDGVDWLGWTQEPKANPEIAIAVDDPALLAHAPHAEKRFVWAHGTAASLDVPAAVSSFGAWRPDVVFHTMPQRDRWLNANGLTTHVVEPAPGHAFLDDFPVHPAEPPRLLTVCHPLGGLERLVRLFAERIRPAVPNAELRVYSALLDRGRWGGDVPAAVRPVHELCQAWASAGVTVHPPQPDPQMADAYRQARGLLHPSLAEEPAAIVLMEAQAACLPVIGFMQSAVAFDRVADGVTGKLAASDDAFVEAAVELLTSADTHARYSGNCKTLRRGRTWAIAAAEWEELFA